MDNTERVLKILLKLSADTSGATQTTAALKGVEAQAAKTSTAVSSSGGGNAALQARALEIQQRSGATMERSLQVAGRMMATEQEILAIKEKAAAVINQQADGTARVQSGGIGVGNALAIGAVAGMALYNIIGEVGEEVVRLAEEERRMTAELDVQVDKWIQLAENAKDFGDVTRPLRPIAQFR